MSYINPIILYQNSFLKYSDKKQVKIDEINRDIYIYLLDKRFIINKNIDLIRTGFPYCKIIDLDDYWYKIYSSYPLNNSNIFYKLIEKSIIYNIENFNNLI